MIVGVNIIQRKTEILHDTDGTDTGQNIGGIITVAGGAVAVVRLDESLIFVI